MVVGGFAIRTANYNRRTMDVDLVVASDLENEAKVYSALSTLPDNAVRELQPGEPQKYNVIRVGDEILVDLMVSAGGIDYATAARDVVVREVDGVPIPFASPRLLWHMKALTHRAKDAGDLVFFATLVCRTGRGAAAGVTTVVAGLHLPQTRVTCPPYAVVREHCHHPQPFQDLPAG